MNTFDTVIIAETQSSSEDEDVPKPEQFQEWLSSAAQHLMHQLSSKKCAPQSSEKTPAASRVAHTTTHPTTLSPALDIPISLAERLSALKATAPLSILMNHCLQKPANTVITLSVTIVDAEESRALNFQHRQKDKPTNVLSFPGLFNPALQLNQLGDLVLCAPVIKAESHAQQKSLHQHWAHMLIHGFLHLAGFDHEETTDADLMETLEIRILAHLGFPNPYVMDETGIQQPPGCHPDAIPPNREHTLPLGDIATEALP